MPFFLSRSCRGPECLKGIIEWPLWMEKQSYIRLVCSDYLMLRSLHISSTKCYYCKDPLRATLRTSDTSPQSRAHVRSFLFPHSRSHLCPVFHKQTTFKLATQDCLRVLITLLSAATVSFPLHSLTFLALVSLSRTNAYQPSVATLRQLYGPPFNSF